MSKPNLRRNAEINTPQSTHEIARLKALTVEMDKTINISQSGCRELKAEVDRLKAQVDRLTKAGDAMASSIQFNEEMAQDYNGPTIVHQSVQRWRYAKEGKGQS